MKTSQFFLLAAFILIAPHQTEDFAKLVTIFLTIVSCIFFFLEP